LRARIKGSLPIRFTEQKLTSYGGLELIRQFLRSSGFLARLKEGIAVREFDTDYGSYRMALALIGMLIVGGSRLRHLRLLAHDPRFLCFAQLT
jgi:hypothetical protein